MVKINKERKIKEERKNLHIPENPTVLRCGHPTCLVCPQLTVYVQGGDPRINVENKCKGVSVNGGCCNMLLDRYADGCRCMKEKKLKKGIYVDRCHISPFTPFLLFIFPLPDQCPL